MRWWSQQPSWARAAVGMGGVALFLVIAVAVVYWLPPLVADHDLGPKDEAEDEGRVRTALLALLAGTLAAVGAIYTARTFALNRAGQITERFTRAIDQIGNDKPLEVRLGGIYALERIARDSRDDHRQVMEVLTAYVRENAPPPSEPETLRPEMTVREFVQGPRPSTDVQAILTVLGRRDRSHERSPLTLDLADTNLQGATLRSAHLERANLTEAHLEDAHLDGAHLEDARLVAAHLEMASLKDAHLERAELRANLELAVLAGAHLEGANLRDAHLEKGVLDGAHLEGADLKFASLEGASLEGAVFDAKTVWPEGFDAEAAGARRLGG